MMDDERTGGVRPFVGGRKVANGRWTLGGRQEGGRQEGGRQEAVC